MRNIGRLMRIEMKKRGWNGVEMARRSGLSEPSISLYIREQRQPEKLKALLGIAKAFEMTLNQLIGRNI